MTILRKKYSTKMKVKISLEAIKQQKTTSEITAQYGVHATQINLWKKQARDSILIFENSSLDNGEYYN